MIWVILVLIDSAIKLYILVWIKKIWGKESEKTHVGFVGTTTNLKKERFVGFVVIVCLMMVSKLLFKLVLFLLRSCLSFCILVAMTTRRGPSFLRLKGFPMFWMWVFFSLECWKLEIDLLDWYSFSRNYILCFVDDYIYGLVIWNLNLIIWCKLCRLNDWSRCFLFAFITFIIVETNRNKWF